MKILHIRNYGGVASTLSRAQRELGHKADVMVFSKHPYEFEEDYVFNFEQQKHFRTIKILYKLFKHRNYDIFHFHGGELRSGLKIHEANTRKCLVSTLDLLNYTKQGVWLPNPVDPKIFSKYDAFSRRRDVIIVGTYAPIEPYVRKFLLINETIKAVLHLKSLGYRVNYKLLQNIPHKMIPDFLSTIDIWVDKFGANAYGTLAIEAALSGCAVITQYDQRYKEVGCPFINLLNKDSLEDYILKLIEDEESRLKIAEDGKAYALRVHNPLECAKKSIEFYEKYAIDAN